MDGLLTHLEFRRQKGDDYRLLPTKSVVDFVPRLPIVQTGGIYHCSVSIFPNQTLKAMTTFYKRFDSKRLQENGKGKIDRGRGFFKDFILRTPYLATDLVLFYVTLEDPKYRSWLEDCLHGLSGLGKEINVGFGRIKEFQIEEETLDLGFVDEAGRAMRPIPVSLLASYKEVERVCARPPYWDRSNAELCAVPFTQVTLRKEETR